MNEDREAREKIGEILLGYAPENPEHKSNPRDIIARAFARHILSTLHELDYQNLNAQAWVDCPYCIDENCPACTSGKMYLVKVGECECGGQGTKIHKCLKCNGTGQIISPLTWKEWYEIQVGYAFQFRSLVWKDNVLYGESYIDMGIFTLPDGSHIKRRGK